MNTSIVPMRQAVQKTLKNVVDKHGLEDWHINLLNYSMLPKALRPKVDEICGKLGISRTVYFYWLRDPRFNEARKEFIKQYYFDDLPDVLYALKNESLSGNERAIRLFLEFVSGFKSEEEKERPIDESNHIPVQEVNVIINNLEQKFYGKSRSDERIEEQTGSKL